LRHGEFSVSIRIGVVMPPGSGSAGGVERFAESLLPELRRRADVVAVRVHPQAGQSRAEGLINGVSALWRAHSKQRLDAVFSTFHYPPAMIPGVPMLGFIHDLRGHGLQSTVDSSDWMRISPAAWRIRALVRTFSRVLVPSSHVRRDVEWLCRSATVVAVGEGVDHLHPVLSPEHVVAPRNKVVVIGGNRPHKRVGLGLAAGAMVARQSDYEVHLVGGRGGMAIPSGVRHAEGYLDDAELSALLRQTAVVIAPTSYEGFGLAVGEGLWAGASIVHARDCSLHGLVGDAGVGVEPVAGAMAQHALALAGQDSRRVQRALCQARRWTWGQTAERVLEQCAEATQSPPATVTRYPEC
jgi:glycosyltransferase involved in cell wall biosynthesis